ncbi:SUKH-3 domain-containing protein [Isoptericola sp. NPDC019693]|uniref:SUKH-3 domain-containing protein n=1 Tax=Isoptericola sp. NPDC019693 TaxID=3364009 RepID=UPI00378A8690
MTSAQDLLLRSGWTPNRHVDVEGMAAKLKAAGHLVIPTARVFLAEFSGLVIAYQEGRSALRIDGNKAALHADPDWCEAYAEGIGRAVTPVGEYSHMTLVIDESGAFWGGFDANYGLMGETITEVIQALLIDPGSRQLDHLVHD